jgi:trk system potassium uptake protein
VFHSVSAFCNAGFSTESAGLYTESLRFNYPLQLIIAILIILGGMGFPIVFNIFSFLRARAIALLARITKNPAPDAMTRIIHANSKLALTTTIVLLVFGFIMYFFFEYDASLKDHHTWIGKIVTSFFGSVTPRTAGFNTVDMTRLSIPITIIYLLLMWIGASPSSTGGGIKTTTAAVAFLNFRTIIRGRNRTEVYRTQISESSINRAFALIMLSLLIIGMSVLLISIYDGDKGTLKITFEAISAFSTVGLTLGITPELSEVSKIVLVITMFIGRVGALTILIALINQTKDRAYQYPVEEIMY